MARFTLLSAPHEHSLMLLCFWPLSSTHHNHRLHLNLIASGFRIRSWFRLRETVQVDAADAKFIGAWRQILHGYIPRRDAEAQRPLFGSAGGIETPDISGQHALGQMIAPVFRRRLRLARFPLGGFP